MALSLPRGPRGLGTGVGDQHLVSQFFEQVACPAGVRPYLHGYSTGRVENFRWKAAWVVGRRVSSIKSPCGSRIAR